MRWKRRGKEGDDRGILDDIIILKYWLRCWDINYLNL